MSTQSATSPNLLSPSLLTGDQQNAIDAIYSRNQLLVAKMGAGKTIIGATAITELLEDKQLERVLIVTTPKIANTVWQHEFSLWEHTAHISIAAATGDPAQRRNIIENQAIQVVIVTFNVLPWMKDNNLFQHFDGLLIDESTKLKEAGGAQFKALRSALPLFNWRCAMTGTPVSENLLSLYTQAMIIDGGKTLGKRKDRFMNTYFYPTDFNQYNWEIKPGHADILLKDVEHLIHVMPDYRDELPQLIERTHFINMPEHLRQAYEHLKKDSVLGDVSAANAAVLVGKLQQVSSGFLYSETEEEALRLSEYRLDMLEVLLRAITGNVVVAYWFKEDLDAIKARFPHAEEITPRNMKLQVKRWNEGDIELLLIHPRSAGHGLQLERGGHDLIWYTPQWSNDLYHQTNARLWRRGQINDVTVHSLVAVDTVDEIITQRVEDKDRFDQMLTAHFRG